MKRAEAWATRQISSSGFNGTLTLNEAIERDAQYSSQRLFSVLFSVFPAMALALALVGIFSLAAYSVRSALQSSASAWHLVRRAGTSCGSRRTSR